MHGDVEPTGARPARRSSVWTRVTCSRTA